MLTYNQFKTMLLEELGGRIAPSMELRVSKVLKNNDVYLDSVSILDSEASTNVTPVAYLQHYFSQYENGISMKQIVNSIFTLLATHENIPSFDIQDIESFDKAKERIMVAVINMELNHERLCNMVHRPWQDLAIVYRYNVRPWDESPGSIMITNQLMERWNVTEEDLYQVAVENTRRQTWVSKSILDTMKELISDSEIEKELALPELCPDMYVLTSTDKFHGASAILFPELFEDFIQDNQIECTGLYILPSSIHELIVIPAVNQDDNADDLKDIVNKVNNTVMERPDILSFSVYFYDPVKKCIGISD